MPDKETLAIRLKALSGMLTAIWEMSETGGGQALTNALYAAMDYTTTIIDSLDN